MISETMALPISFVENKNRSMFSKITAEYWESFLSMKYGKIPAKKTNMILTELIDNAMEHTVSKLLINTSIFISISIYETVIKISVSNAIESGQFESLSAFIKRLSDAEFVNNEFIDRLMTNNERVGGLGLLKLVKEDRCTIDITSIEKEYILYAVISAEFTI